MNTGFFTLHSDVPCEGPGDAETLSWAMELAGVGRDARIVEAMSGADEDMMKVLEVQEAEIALWRRYRDEFGYALAVVRPK